MLVACVALRCLQQKFRDGLQTFFGRVRLGIDQASMDCGWCSGTHSASVAGSFPDHVTLWRKKWVVTHLITWGDFGKGAAHVEQFEWLESVGLADG